MCTIVEHLTFLHSYTVCPTKGGYIFFIVTSTVLEYSDIYHSGM